MNYKYYIAIVFFFCLQNVSAQKNEAQETQYFIRLLTKKFEWMLKKDTVQLQSLLHDSLVYIHSGGQQDSKKSLLNSLFSTQNPYKKFTTAKERVRFINNNTVIVHAELAIDYKVDETKNSLLLTTEVYSKEKNQWWLVSRHANKLIR